MKRPWGRSLESRLNWLEAHGDFASVAELFRLYGNEKLKKVHGRLSALFKRLCERLPAGASTVGKNRYGCTEPVEGAEWSGNYPVPKIGDRITVTVNGWGPGRVVGYFAEDGGSALYLGIYVATDLVPLWYIRQFSQEPRARLAV